MRLSYLLHLLSALSFSCLFATSLNAQGSTAPKDVLLFADGEKLIGQLQRADGNSIVFKSDMAGSLTIDWSKIKELHSGQRVVVVRKGTKLIWRGVYPGVPKGELSADGTNLQVQPSPPAPPATVSVADTQAIIPETDFYKAVTYRPRLLEDWKGDVSLGASLIQATQKSRAYTSSLNLIRLVPLENWLEPVNRTIISFTSAYGRLSEPGVPAAKTSMYHADSERDEYFTPSVYVLVGAGFDHDFSQGLNLQQSYGAGLGWTVVKNPAQWLDLKAELNYVRQQFQTASQNQRLIGSIFSESFLRKFRNSIALQEQLTINPAWSNLRAYSATGNVSVTVPVFKRIGLTMSSTDTFLNDPSPGFRKNSLQFSTALTYTAR